MLDAQTTISWAMEMCEFVNGAPANAMHALFAADASDWGAEYRLPTEPRTPEQIGALRKALRRRFSLLARNKKRHRRELRREVERWLDDPLVRSTNPNYNLTPMDGILSLSPDDRLQVTPNFRSRDARYAATFAELVGPDSPVVIRCCRFRECGHFFVHVVRGRGRPFENCPQHHSDSAAGRTARTRKRRRKLVPRGARKK